MADTINLSDVSTKDDSKLKTGGRRKHTMPTPKLCNQIKDPVEKKKCLEYKGEWKGMLPYKKDSSKYSKKKKKSKKKLYNVTKQKAIKKGYI